MCECAGDAAYQCHHGSSAGGAGEAGGGEEGEGREDATAGRAEQGVPGRRGPAYIVVIIMLPTHIDMAHSIMTAHGQLSDLLS